MFRTQYRSLVTVALSAMLLVGVAATGADGSSAAKVELYGPMCGADAQTYSNNLRLVPVDDEGHVVAIKVISREGRGEGRTVQVPSRAVVSEPIDFECFYVEVTSRGDGVAVFLSSELGDGSMVALGPNHAGATLVSPPITGDDAYAVCANTDESRVVPISLYANDDAGIILWAAGNVLTPRSIWIVPIANPDGSNVVAKGPRDAGLLCSFITMRDGVRDSAIYPVAGGKL